MYALPMLINYPNCPSKIPNVRPGFLFGGLIFGRIFELAYRGAYSQEGLCLGF